LSYRHPPGLGLKCGQEMCMCSIELVRDFILSRALYVSTGVHLWRSEPADWNWAMTTSMSKPAAKVITTHSFSFVCVHLCPLRPGFALTTICYTHLDRAFAWSCFVGCRRSIAFPQPPSSSPPPHLLPPSSLPGTIT